MRFSSAGFILTLALPLILTGCDWLPGKPDPEHRWTPASQEKEFSALYSQNCQACHSIDGAPALALSMGNPVYLSWVPRDALRKAVAEGVKGTSMPAFSEAQGGLLTDEQIDILVDGILAKKPPVTEITRGQGIFPPYAGVKGDAKKGQALFTTLYGPAVQGMSNPYYLSLVSDGYLRALIVAGFPQWGLPDSSQARPGKPLSNQEVSDVVAWLASQRPAPPSQGSP